MFEKVNPSHPDKVADRIAGAIVDYCYNQQLSPKVAVEVLIGHGECMIINETSQTVPLQEVNAIVRRIIGTDDMVLNYIEVPQDKHLADNQTAGLRCGDNGIFKGMPITEEQFELTYFTRHLYSKFESDGKFVYDKKENKLVICQSKASHDDITNWINNNGFSIKVAKPKKVIINPLGDWTGGINVDSGATNRKLGSDMGDSITGGGLHGKDLTKADVSVNIYAFMKAQMLKKPVELSCAIGDEYVDGKPYAEIIKIARHFIASHGGFEEFAKWGLIR